MAKILKNNISLNPQSIRVNVNGVGKEALTVKSQDRLGNQTVVFDTFDKYEYGNVLISAFSFGDIPADGSPITPSALSYSQIRAEVGNSGERYNEDVLSSVAEISYSGEGVDPVTGAIGADDLGTEEAERRKITSVTVTVKLNGKSASKTVDVYQAGNTDAVYGAVTCSASVSDIPASGGSVTVTRTATQTITYPSGKTRQGKITWNTSDVTASASSLGATEKARTAVKTFDYVATGEGGMSAACSCTAYQQANAFVDYSYDTPTISASYPKDIAASGETVALSTPSVSQVRRYNYTAGNDQKRDTLTSGGTVYYSLDQTSGFSTDKAAVNSTASSLLATEKARTAITTAYFYVVMNGKTSATASAVSYQEANALLSYSYDTPSISFSSAVSAVPAAGATRTCPSATYSQVRRFNYTSGNDQTRDTLTTGGTVYYGTATNPSSQTDYSKVTITGSNLGSTEKNETTIGTFYAKVVINGKSKETSVNVVQSANAFTEYEYDAPAFTLGSVANIPAAGGTSVAPSVTNISQNRYYCFTSGHKVKSDSVTTGYTIYYGLAANPTSTTASSATTTANSLGATVTTAVTSIGTAYVKVTMNGKSTEKSTAINQAVNSFSEYEYDTPTLTLGTIGDIPAGGGTSAVPSISYSQTRYYCYTSGHKAKSDTVSSGATVYYGTATAPTSTSSSSCQITKSSLGATTKDRTNVGTCYIKITLNGKSAEKSVTVYQAANAFVSYSYDTPSVTVTCSDVPASGGSVTSGTATYSQVRRYNYTAGNDQARDTLTTGGTVTWSGGASNIASLGATEKARTAVGSALTASVAMNGKTGTGSATVYQAANAFVSYSYDTPTGRTLSVSDIPASGGDISSGTTGGTISQVRRYNYTSGNDQKRDTLTNPTVSASSYSTKVSGSNLTTTATARTKKGTLTHYYTCNGKQGSCSADVYQAENKITNSNYSPKNYVATCSIGSGITAGGGSATVTASAYHDAYNYYTSGSSDSTTHRVNDTSTLSIASQTATRYSISGTTLSHSKMGTTTGTDSVTVRCTNASSTSTYKDASTSVTNTQTKNTGSYRSYGTPTISIGSGITAGGGSATITASVTDVRYYYYTYTDTSANEGATAHYENVAGTVTLTIASQTASRYSISGTTLSHSKMGTTTGTDSVTVRATNKLSTTLTKDASTSVTNTQTKVKDGIKSYGTPTCSIGSGLTANGGSATVSHGVTNVRYYHYTYTDTSANESANAHYENETGSTTISITSNGNSRFSLSGNTLSHSSMTTNVTTDSVTVRAVNAGSTSLVKDASTSITNTRTEVLDGIKSYGTPTVSIGSGITAGGGSAAITRSVTNVRYYHYTYTASNSNEAANAHYKDEAGTVTLSIASQTASRYSISGTTLSHSKMGTTTGDDSVTVRATNAGSTSLYKDATTKVTNTRTKNTGSIRSYGTPSVSIGTGMTAAGGSATVTHSVTNSRYWYYTYTDTSANEGTTAHYEDVAGTTTITISSNGNSRFSLSGNTLTHTGMGASATTDTVKVKATNSGDTTKTAETSSSITNSAGTQHYKNTSGTTGDNWTYGTPTKPTLTSKLAANGGTVTISGSTVTNTKTYYLKYTSGSYGSLITETPAGTIAYEISSNGNSRFAFASGSNTTINHSNMTTNATTDTVGVKAYNTSDTSKKSAEATASVTNSYSDAWNNPSVSAFGYATSSFAYNGGSSAAPNSKTASQSGTRTFTSGSTSTISNSTFTWSYSTSSTGFSVNSSTGVVTAASYTGTSARSGVITATATGSGSKTGTKTFTFSQAAHPYAGNEMINLGLPSGRLWAKQNIGATSQTDWGKFYQWGGSLSKGVFGATLAEVKAKTWEFTKLTATSGTKLAGVAYDKAVATLQSSGIIDSNKKLTSTYDMATQAFASGTHVPTQAEWSELSSYTTKSAWSPGYTLTSKQNNATIFLPQTGYAQASSNVGLISDDPSSSSKTAGQFNYWSSTHTGTTTKAYGAYGDWGGTWNISTSLNVWYGLPVRAVSN